MSEYGITTAKADLWVNIFPHEDVAFVHRPSDSLSYAKTCDLSLMGPNTGRGYCIPRDADHVTRRGLPHAMVRWADGESPKTLGNIVWGDRGVDTVMEMIRRRIIDFGDATITKVMDVATQREGIDIIVKSRDGKKTNIEVKCESVRSKSIFVQHFESYAGACPMTQDVRLGRAPSGEQDAWRERKLRIF